MPEPSLESLNAAELGRLAMSPASGKWLGCIRLKTFVLSEYWSACSAADAMVVGLDHPTDTMDCIFPTRCGNSGEFHAKSSSNGSPPSSSSKYADSVLSARATTSRYLLFACHSS